MPAGGSFPGKYPVALKGFSSFGYGNEPVPRSAWGIIDKVDPDYID
jgi:hypothetical protein